MTHSRFARVAVDTPLLHLDRPFDYAVSDEMAADVQPGVRVRVRFAGRLRDGYVLSVSDQTDVEKPALLERVTSPEVVLTPTVAKLVRQVADHWVGTFSDVVRLAVPPRHAAAEKAARPQRPAPTLDEPATVLPTFDGGDRFLTGLRAGEPIRAGWCPVPVHGPNGDWAGGLLEAVVATVASGRGAIVVVPEGETLGQLVARAEATLGKGSFVTLSAELGPAARYRNFLAVSRGDVRVVFGTRTAVFAPVAQLGLIAVWDEGNDLFAEPRAPYFHTREVAALRAASEQSGLLIGGYGRTAETEALLERGWLGRIGVEARDMRRLGPAVRVAADHDAALDRDPNARDARLPHDAFVTIRAGLAAGPVLIQVPRGGYAPSLVCQGCRTPARCPRCAQPLRGERGTDGLVLVCPSCGPVPGAWRCPDCGDTRLRAPRVGVTRTAEELGRAFPGVRVVSSWSGRVVAEVDDQPALVLATPGAEPRAASGYAAAVLLDTGVLLGRADLRREEEALRRWLGVCAGVRAGGEGGTVLAVGEPEGRALQALVRLDPEGFAARELAERRATHFPPAGRLLVLEGPAAAVADLGAAWAGVAGVEEFGPAPLPEGEVRVTLKCPPGEAAVVAGALRDLLGVRAARKAAGVVRLRVDPIAV